MRPGFRFPRSTMFLMCVILAGVVLAINKAKDVVRMKDGLAPGTIAVWDPMLWSVPIVLLVVAGAAATVWGILFALHRTGMQRLDNIATSSDRQ